MVNIAFKFYKSQHNCDVSEVDWFPRRDLYACPRCTTQTRLLRTRKWTANDMLVIRSLILILTTGHVLDISCDVTFHDECDASKVCRTLSRDEFLKTHMMCSADVKFPD